MVDRRLGVSAALVVLGSILFSYAGVVANSDDEIDVDRPVQIRSRYPHRCLELAYNSTSAIIAGTAERQPTGISARMCSVTNTKQFWVFNSTTGGIHQGNNCLLVQPVQGYANYKVGVSRCGDDENQLWTYNDQKLVNLRTEQCLQMSSSDLTSVSVNSCGGSSADPRPRSFEPPLRDQLMRRWNLISF